MGGADTLNVRSGVLSGLMPGAWALILQKIRIKTATIKKNIDAVHIHHNAPPRVTPLPHANLFAPGRIQALTPPDCPTKLCCALQRGAGL